MSFPTSLTYPGFRIRSPPADFQSHSGAVSTFGSYRILHFSPLRNSHAISSLFTSHHTLITPTTTHILILILMEFLPTACTPTQILFFLQSQVKRLLNSFSFTHVFEDFFVPSTVATPLRCRAHSPAFR